LFANEYLEHFRYLYRLGPLSVETKERERRIRHSLNKDKNALREPEQVEL